MSNQQLRLVRLAPENVVVAAVHQPGLGWAVSVKVRRGDETWQEAGSRTFERLATYELPDAIVGSLDALLGLE